jgi:hypothetical protein
VKIHQVYRAASLLARDFVTSTRALFLNVGIASYHLTISHPLSPPCSCLRAVGCHACSQQTHRRLTSHLLAVTSLVITSLVLFQTPSV